MPNRIPNSLGNNDAKDTPRKQEPGAGLVGYILPKLRHARDVRDNQYGFRWAEYTRLWRGFWDPADKNTNSERSRLIAPALQQAIEMTSSEIEEAAFGRIAWFDIEDDIGDEQKDDALLYRDQLLEDFELANVPGAAAAVFLLGCIYGTGIGKINVTKNPLKRVVDGQTQSTDQIICTLDAVRPDQFVIDPGATDVDEAHFVAHDMIKPLHTIKAKQKSGVYRKGAIWSYSGSDENRPRGDSTGTGLTSNVEPQDDAALITEYFGKVPAKLLRGFGSAPSFGEDDSTLVEALVTIMNDSKILRAVESPFVNKDRPIIAYQHDTVPGEFWGRGVSEKGYNPQKALDSEIRARMDALALTTAPMLGADITRLPRNPDLRVRPGKVMLTRGRASEIIEPIGFSPQSLALTFQQSGDLERMVQMGTGAMDSATPLNTARRNETVGGMGMMQSGFLKRAKRTMQNIERSFLDPLIRKSLWRYMQFAPERYPNDMKFVVHSTMGLMAKEVEQATLVQVLGYTPPESPAHGVLLSAILKNTTSSEAGDIKQAVEAMLAPPTPEEQQMAQAQQKLALEGAQEQLNEQKLKNAKLQAEIAKIQAETEEIQVDTELADDKVEIDAANAAVNAENARNRQRDIDAKREIASQRGAQTRNQGGN